MHNGDHWEPSHAFGVDFRVHTKSCSTFDLQATVAPGTQYIIKEYRTMYIHAFSIAADNGKSGRQTCRFVPSIFVSKRLEVGPVIYLILLYINMVFNV
jgi:hypothetical protein